MQIQMRSQRLLRRQRQLQLRMNRHRVSPSQKKGCKHGQDDGARSKLEP